jgi:maltose-binding protein MalE
MTSSGSPDAIMTYAYDQVPSWAANGFIQPMDQYAKQVGIKQSDYFPFTWNMMNYSGHIWGLLQEFDLYLFFYDQGRHHGAAPTTIDQLDALSQRYTKFDKHGDLQQVGIVPWEQGDHLVWGALWGAQFYDRSALKWTINTPQNRRFLEWYLKYVHMVGGPAKAAALVTTVQKGYQGDLFTGGKAVFGLEGQWMNKQMKTVAPKIKFGIAPLPHTKYVPYKTALTEGGNLFLLPTKSPHPKESAFFIRYMASASSVFRWDVTGGDLPPLRDVALVKNSLGRKWLKNNPLDSHYVDVLKAGHVQGPIPSPHLPFFNDQMTAAIQEVIFKRQTPAQALAGVAQKVGDQVSQFKSLHPTWKGE